MNFIDVTLACKDDVHFHAHIVILSTLDPVEIEEGGGEGEVMGAEGLSFYRRALRTG